MEIRIALAGNPNSGKTTLFNALTGSNQFVGNWPGVTVEKKEGKLKKHNDVIITDLPGIYSLSPYTLEEVVARNYLIGERPDAILNIVDGTNLERNLYLTTQLTELGIPVVIAINMMDVVEKNGDHIDTEELSRQLGLFPDPSDLTVYAFRAYVDGVEGLAPNMAEEYYVPKGLPGWSPICTTWLNPHYGGKQAVLGLTINEDALRDSGLSAMEFYEYWRDNTKFGQERLKNATLIDKFRGWRLPGCRQLGKSVVPGAIAIGDAVGASECAFDYGIPSAMTGGMIAANVIAGCAAKDDFSYEELNAYQKMAEEALNPSLGFNAIFRDELLNKEDVMKDFFKFVKAQPGYPNVMFGDTAAKYMMEVLKLDLGGNKSNQ